MSAAVAVAAAAVVASGPAGGQVPEPGRRVIEATRPEAPDARRAPLPERDGIPPSRLAPIADGAPFLLREVRVEGASVFAPAEFSAIWEDLLGEEVSPRQAAAIAQEVERFYRERGYVFTRVLPGRPDAAAGVIPIAVVEARIEVVSVEEPEGPVGPVKALMERLARTLEGRENPTLEDLERVLLLLNEIPGITRATAIPRAGEGGAGAVALTINAVRDPFGGAVFADNLQAPAFGPGTAGVFAEARSYSAAGDTTGVTLVNSFWDDWPRDFEERWIAQVEHARYVGVGGSRVGARVLVSESEPGDELARLQLSSEEFELELWGEHPLILTRPLSVWLRGGFDYRNSDLNRPGGRTSSDDTRMIFVEARALGRDGGGYTLGTLGMATGLDVFNPTGRGARDASRGDGDPTAALVRASAEREQALVGPYSLFARIEGQYASQPLFSSQEFALGGTTFGRGYDPSEALGDDGVGATLELRRSDRVTLGGLDLGLTVFGFADYGRVWNKGQGVPEANELVSFGLGLRAQITQRAELGLTLAQPMEELQRDGSDDPRLFFAAQFRF